MEPTKLTRKQYLAKINNWLANNQEQWQQIRATQKYPYSYLQSVVSPVLGEPIWRDRPGRNSITGTPITPDDPGVGFKLFPVANGKVGAKSDPTRKATRGNSTKNSSGTRQYIERATSPPGTDFHASNRRVGEANTRGFDGGHKTHLGRQLAGQEFKVQQGRGTVQEYQSNFLNAGLTIGHTVENIEDQTPEDNRIRQLKDYAKLDRALADLEVNTRRMNELLDKSKKPPKSNGKRNGNGNGKRNGNGNGKRNGNGNGKRNGLSISGGFFDIPEIQNEFNLDPAIGTPLGGGRIIEMGDLSFGTV